MKVAKAGLNDTGVDLLAKVEHVRRLLEAEQNSSFKITKLQIVTIIKNIIKKVLYTICDSKSNDV